MRSLLAVLLLVLLGACSSGNDPEPRPAAPAPSSTPTSAPSSAPSSGSGESGSNADACAEVVAGIDAFNLGDYDATVEHFEKALPLAEKADDGSTAASDLLEAVKYYAELAPDDYLDASKSSPDFAKYKEITLGQCIDGGVVESPSAPGVEA